jgi:hypothetical protein
MDERHSSRGESLRDDAPWDPWRPEEVARRFAGSTLRWYVVAGWALDLFRGEQTRDHEDIEIGVPSADFPMVQEALEGFEFDVVGSGEWWPVDDAAFNVHFQTWVRDPTTGVYHLDVFRDPHDGDTWICRRDHSIRMPYDDLVSFTPNDIPFMAPEVALLFKAKHNRVKDQSDFDGIAPLLSKGQTQWLREGLLKLHPGHPWIPALRSQ